MTFDEMIKQGREILLQNEKGEKLLMVTTDATLDRIIEAIYPVGTLGVEGASKGYIELVNFLLKRD